VLGVSDSGSLQSQSAFLSGKGAVLVKNPISAGGILAFRNNDSSGHQILNEILLKLSPKEAGTLMPHLEFVRLKLHTVLHEAGEEIKSIYFPNTGLQSVLVLLTSGQSVEVGLIGKEGFVGAPIIAGFRTSATRVITQGDATAFRVTVHHLMEILPRSPGLERQMRRYAQDLGLQAAQIAACNCLHNVQQRLARWILMCRERMDSDKFPLTQEFLAQMLGIRRASVSLAASTLQEAGCISYTRGNLTITDQAKLRLVACDCYESIQRQLAAWGNETHEK
jgi:CRP-like cAMP-binding protein